MRAHYGRAEWGVDEDSRFWRRIEGDQAVDEQDAEHWVHVYEELLATLRSVDRSSLDPGRIETLIRVFELRAGFWRSLGHDEPVRAARRRRGAAPAERRRTTA